MKRDFIFGIAAAFALAGLAAGCSTRDTDAGTSGTGSLQLKGSGTRAEGSAAGTGYSKEISMFFFHTFSLPSGKTSVSTLGVS